MNIFLHYATAYVIKQITIVYQCEFSVFHNCCYFFVLVFNSIDLQVFISKDSPVVELSFREGRVHTISMRALYA